MKEKFYFTLTEVFALIVIYSVILSIIISSNFDLKQTEVFDTIKEINAIKSKYDRFTLKYGDNVSEIEKTIVVDANTKSDYSSTFDNLILSEISTNKSKKFAIINVEGNPYLFMGIEDEKFELSNDTFTPLEAFIIDSKIDDGLPNSGKIKVYSGDGKNNCYYDNYYNIKNKKKACSLISLIE